jgi:hypothetical protein
MGAWGAKAFENDSAMDWLAELETGGVHSLRHILSSIADTGEDEYLDVDDGSAAVAGAEIVAAASGHGRTHVPKRLGAWLDANAPAVGPAEVALARRAVQRVLAGNSELRQLWDGHGPDSAWHADMRRLVEQLGGDVGAVPTGPGPAAARAPEERYANEKQALLTFLRARGLVPTEVQEARILASHDVAEINRWLAGADRAASVDALLGDTRSDQTRPSASRVVRTSRVSGPGRAARAVRSGSTREPSRLSGCHPRTAAGPSTGA